jgi:hypothetical protein
MKDQLSSPFFMNAIIIMSWAIWITRNDLIFNGIQPTILGCQRTFLKEISLVKHRVKLGLGLLFS